MKKVLSLVLALLMTASSASAVLADDVVAIAEEPVAVEEVAEEVEAGQYDKAIEFLANYGIFKGYNADDTGAEDLIQRYQMALFVGRIATGWVDDEQWEDGPENWSEFNDIDVDPVNKYYGALSFANQKGIIEGYGNGKFGPTDSIKYQDALTMVVRTLGYTGLDWPWGYIQKAVELGLTDGITGVAYTDELTRGEVAQIIYNALFATTKSGTTLGLSSFGIEFGWEKVVITASDLNTFVADKKDAAPKVESNGLYTYYKDSNKTADGYVAFQLLNDDGTLGEDTYYVLGSELGLTGADHAHDDEAVVGEPYYVLFEKDEDSNLVKVVAYESLYVGTVANEGKTDDEGEAQDYAIQEFLKDNVIVGKYTTNEYLNVTASGKNEILVYSATSNITEEYVDGNLIAIDWETGDILAPVVDEDGDIVVDEDDNTVYEVEWYYNDLLGNYYRYKLNAAKDQIVGIDYMTEEEFLDTYEELNVVKTRDVKGFAQISSVAKTAYAALDLYDTNLDGVADRGIYESYRLAKFVNSTVWCGSCGKNLSAYSFETVKNYSKAVAAAKAEGEDIAAGTVTFVAENVSACTHNNSVRGWFVDGYTPVEAYDEEGEFTGYADGYVIYGADAETGAIKVVKNINDGTDEDSYVATGVLRAYNLKNGTVTIGETKFDVADYDELAGNSFRYVTKNYTTRACYTEYLRDLFNQFVEYVVVDGELVTVRAKSGSTSKLFVVDSYAGMSSDGYIVVNGYFTDTLEYTQIRVATVDNWYDGDFFYYLDEDKAEESFTKGAMYAVSSYDKSEDAYYVQLAGAFDKDGNYTVDTSYVRLDAATIAEDEDGYAVVTIKGETKTRKMKSTDKYVIVLAETEKRPYAPVIVYEGKLADGWTIEGDIINTDDENAGTYVIVNAVVNGFADTYKTGLVLLLDDTYYSVSYNGTDDEDWYLLGASAYEVEAFDLLTGKADAVYYATNKNLKVGHVYFTQDGVIVEDKGIETLAEIMVRAEEAYGEDSIETAEYWFAKATITEANYADLFTGDKDLDEKFVFANTDFATFAGVSKFYDDIIDAFTVYGVEYDADEEEITDIAGLSKADFEELVEDYAEYAYDVYFVYDVDNADIVAYVDIVEAATTVELVEGSTKPITVWEDTTYDAEIEAVVDYTAKYVDGKLVGIIVDGVALTFVGEAVETFDHANIDALNFHFGEEGACDVEAILANVEIDGVALDAVGASMVEITYDNHDDVVECELVKGVYVPVKAEDNENFIAETRVDAVDVEILFTATETLENGGWYDEEITLDLELDLEAIDEDGKVVNTIVALD